MRRTVLGLAALTLTLGLGATPAHADTPYDPAESDFAACPAKPAGAQDWTCYVLTTLDGQVRLRNMNAHVNTQYRLTVAQGKLAGGATVAKMGAVQGAPIPFVTGIINTPLEIPHFTGWKLQIAATPYIEPGLTMPSKFGLKARIVGDGLGDNCWIGSDAAPVVVQPRPQWALPWFFGNTLMVKSKVYDDVFAILPATGCASLTPNILIGAANATSNHLDITWAIRHKTF
ncbi:MAG: hypothetical protein ABIS86_01585 [Streptosporangiaceae bacterium]